MGEAFHATEGRTAVGLRGAVRAVAGSVEVADGGGVVEGRGGRARRASDWPRRRTMTTGELLDRLTAGGGEG